ncbi:MerR family transcriptional regulator [Geodermatophilus arenarius]|uniref:MerR family transcriptional regulator n=1 Tax=Geodermatophilus arenarius TaxID=1137990 RepID=A0ABV9LLL0_9ACTN
MGRLLQIGQVAERTGLSLRTIRFYEESGLVLPSGRTEGGFRLYGEDAVARLEVVKRMKPLGLTLDEVRELLTLLDDLAARPGDTVLTGRLRVFHEAALARVEALRAELAVAEDFAGTLAARLEATR